MTQSLKDQVFKSLSMINLAGKHNLRAKPYDFAYDLKGVRHISWQVRLYPVGGVSGDIRVVFKVLDSIDEVIHVFLSDVDDGCLILH